GNPVDRTRGLAALARQTAGTCARIAPRASTTRQGRHMSSPIIEEPIEIRTDDGVSEGWVFRPEGKSVPGVVHLTDVAGIRPSHKEMARRLAAEGYAVLMPNIFYRTSKVPVFDFTPNFSGEQRTSKRLGELTAPL